MLRKILMLMVVAALLTPVYAVTTSPLPLRVSGPIAEINADLQSITVKTPINTTVFKVVAETKITVDGAPATFQDLKVGYNVVAAVMQTDKGLVAVYVNASTGQQTIREVAGVIAAVKLDLKRIVLKTPDREMVFLVTEKTVITREGQPVTLDKLKVGDNAKVGFVESSAGLVAVRIEAMPKPPIKKVGGKISEIGLDARTFTITNEAGATLKLNTNENTVIIKNLFPADLSKLAIGDFARVAFFRDPEGRNVAVRVDATSEGATTIRLRGVIAEIGIENHVIVLQTPDARIPVLVAPGTEIIKFQMPVQFPALMVGDKVELAALKVEDGKAPIAIRINVIPNQIAGVITAISLDAHTVTIQREAASMTLRVVEKTIITRNGLKVPFTALKVRDFAGIDFFNFPDGAVAARIMARGI